MIQSNELRIGNLLRDKVSKTELKVIELTEMDIVTYVIDRSKFPLAKGWGIEQIPITEEWLLRLGWIWNDETKSFEKNGFPNMHIRQTEFGWHMFNYVLNSMTTNKGFYFVHQLQNLYFALTGEELTLKTEL